MATIWRRLFGDEEEIRGYDGLSIDIYMTPQFQALIDVKYADKGPKATDLKTPFANGAPTYLVFLFLAARRPIKTGLAHSGLPRSTHPAACSLPHWHLHLPPCTHLTLPPAALTPARPCCLLLVAAVFAAGFCQTKEELDAALAAEPPLELAKLGSKVVEAAAPEGARRLVTWARLSEGSPELKVRLRVLGWPSWASASAWPR